MKLAILGFCLTALGLWSLPAQTSCPPINFLTVPHAAVQAGGASYVLARQPDGSYSEFDYSIDLATVKTTHQVKKTGSSANIQQNMVNCLGLGSRPRHAAAANLKADVLGASMTAGWAVADLAGDGIGSLAGIWQSEFGDQLIVSRAAQDYSIATSAFYTVGPQPAIVLAADFNGDGKKDIAVLYYGSSTGSNLSGGVSLLLGNGDGTLKPTVNFPLPGTVPLNGTVYDFNGDGAADIAVADDHGGITVIFGNKNGTLTLGKTYPVSTTPLTSVAVADANGDGKPDLLAFQIKTGIAVLTGNGDGTFQTGALIPFNLPSANIASADFNKDGIPDITLFSGGNVYLILGTGGGKFSSPVLYQAGAGYTEMFFVEDFDGDGNLDVVLAGGHPDALVPVENGDMVSVLFGNGDGTLEAPVMYTLDGDPLDQTQTPTNVVAADFDGDGIPDLATSNASGNSVSILVGQGPAGFKAPKSYSMGNVKPTSIAVGDLTGAGKPDVVVTDGKSNVYVFHNNGDGTLQTPIPYPVNGTAPNSVALGDFNGDKKLDVVAANSGSNNVSVLRGFGDTSFDDPVNYPVGVNPVNVAVGDFNGDGKLDLAVATGGKFNSAGTDPGGISVLLGNGDGTFQQTVNYPAFITAFYPSFVAVGDVNGDKRPDLLVVGQTSAGLYPITVLLGKGDGTFLPALLAGYTNFGPSGIVLDDLNGDGALDVVVPHCCGSTDLTYLVGNGHGLFLTETELSTGSFFSAAVADFNGDGTPDIAATSFSVSSPHVVSTFLNLASAKAQGVLTLTSAAGTPLKGPPLAPFSIATAKGADLATGILINSDTTPPTKLLNTSVTVTDSQQTPRAAQLFYVSPGQVNFLIPQGTATGNATVTVTSGDGSVSTGALAIIPVAPSIFTLNTQALAAAYVQRVHGDGSQSIEYLYAVDAAGDVTFPPIDLGPSTDQVFLNLYGTGISGSPQSQVTVTVGGANAQVFYSGVSGYPGEDQVAILLPRSLVGAGTVDIALTAGGNPANATTLNIK